MSTVQHLKALIRQYPQLKMLSRNSWRLFRNFTQHDPTRRNSLNKIWQSLIKTSAIVYPQAAYLAVFPVVGAVGFGWNKADSNSKDMADSSKLSAEEQLFEKADILFDENDIIQLYELLIPHKDEENAEILWRLARAAHNKGKFCENTADKKAHTYEAYQYILRAIALDEKNYAVHKWYAILLNYTGEYEGSKQQIQNSFKVKEHLIRATELNPKDATSIHSLGFWCFSVADMPWYERKIAAVLFAAPPESSYEEALKYFQQAEQVDPNFYSMNLVLLGKTYLRMKQNDEAISFLKRARDYTVVTEDDKKAHKEATELLKGMGIKD